MADHVGTILPDGSEQCLSCGEPWPCPDAPERAQPAPTRSGASCGKRRAQLGEEPPLLPELAATPAPKKRTRKGTRT